MSNLLEETIIAYYDNRLSDAESADLLHQASRDSEIRRMLRAHEGLRTRMQRASANVVVRPDLEAKLFGSIAGLQAIEESATTPIVRAALLHAPRFRVAVGALAVAALVLIGLNFVAPPKQQVRSIAPEDRALNANAVGGAGESFASNPSVSCDQRDVVKEDIRHEIHAASAPIPSGNANASKAIGFESESPSVRAKSEGSTEKEPIAYPVETLALRSAGPSTIGATRSLGDMYQPLAPVANTDPHFDLAISGASGSMLPFREHELHELGGAQASLGYFISSKNLVGFRLSLNRMHGYVIEPSSGVGPKPDDAKPDDGQSKVLLGEEVFAEHREWLFHDHILASAGVSGGLLPNGNIFGAEIAAKTPIFGELLGGLGVAFTRAHVGATTEAARTVGAAPITVEARNTAKVLLYLGISYSL
jgi:hypothetical protein